MLNLGRINLPSLQFWALLISMSALFFMGGSSRPDATSLALLTPLMIASFGGALITLNRRHFLDNKGLLIGFLIIFLMIGLYLLPVANVDRDLLGGGEQPETLRRLADDRSASYILAIAPHTVLQSFFFLFAPLAVFLYSIQLSRDDLRMTLPVIIGLAAISGIFGVLQLAGNPNGPLYLYSTTNNGSAVGLFANRNHAAVLLACVFPMLTLMVKSRALRHTPKNVSKAIAMAVAILLVPLILVTGSRSGMLAALIGLIGGSLLYFSHGGSHQEGRGDTSFLPIIAMTVILSLVFTTIYLSRAEAIDRLFAEPNDAVDRADFWTSSLKMFWQFFPFGFGPGGFVSAFQINEPLDFLGSVYLNRLHNDWLETALTFGVPGLILMLAGILYFLRRSFVLWVRMDGARTAVALGRTASIVIAILAVASMSDYPLRTPAMAGFAALVLVWFAHARHEPNSFEP